MSGTAILNPNVLVDSLVGLVDGLRRRMYPKFGITPYRVWKVDRTWSGGEIGAGSFTDVETEFDPPPIVEPWDLPFEQKSCGLELGGTVKVRGISLKYRFDEVLKPTEGGVEHLIKISEAHGQANPNLYFTHGALPFEDRPKLGWVLILRFQGGAL